MLPFDYQRVETLAEAVAVLGQDPAGTRLLAGGTDLLVFLTDQKLRLGRLLDAKRATDLPGLEVNGALAVGPNVKLRELERHPAVAARWQALAQGASAVGGVAIRNRATLAGNLGTASPAADTPPALLALGARLELLGPAGRRELPLSEFFVGPGRHRLQPAELIRRVLLPAPPPRSGSWYTKLATRQAMDIAFVGVAAALSLAADGTVASARLGLGAVAPTPVEVDLTALLAGRRLDEDALAAAAEAAQVASSPIDDKRCSALYRRAMVGELTRRGLRQALAQAEAAL
ncbi:MAG: FAD binding domain-containing protein [Fimbriimonadaceae bacterium]|nr:FAD binding domain-containing protein [Fimbriimonadaceae bacterium]